MALGPAAAAGPSFDAAWARSLAAGAHVTVPPGEYLGPWRFAAGVTLSATGATVSSAAGSEAALTAEGDLAISGLTVRAASGSYGIRLGTGRAVLRGVTVLGSDHAAIYLAHGSLVASGLEVAGGEYGLLAEQPSGLHIDRSAFRHQQRAGVAVVGGPLTLARSALVGPFGEAAIALLHGPSARLTDNRLSAVGAIGIKVTNGKATLSGNRVVGARSDSAGREGDGIFAFGSEITLRGERVADCQASALSLIASRATLTGVQFTGPGEAGIFVDRRSALEASDSEVRDVAGGVLIEPGGSAPASGLRYDRVHQPTVTLPP